MLYTNVNNKVLPFVDIYVTFYSLKIMSKIGERIREIRKAKGLSLGQVGLRGGIDRTYISRIESGKVANPSHDTLAKVARGLGLAVPELFIKEKEPLPAVKGHRIAEEELAPYGIEYYSVAEREYIRKLIEIFRSANDKAIMGIKINIDLFHYSSRQTRHKITEGDIRLLLERHKG